ncbi:hypothetical protein GGH13_000230 [Coemansia sp. S155-1]|nr:hypothetical protein GGH13_000230 [Coemansia sp. S155-1]
MADCMTKFIKEHYPVPTPANYRAVSNFIWVAMDDCIRMHDMLQGIFKWTEEKYEQAAALRSQGLTYKEVAWQMSPALSRKAVNNALRKYSSPKQVLEPISADELQDISRLVDEYAGKYTVAEIMDKIRTHFNLVNRLEIYTVAECIAAHPHYEEKLADIDYSDLANRIQNKQTSVILTAEELNVPLCILMARLVGSVNYSSVKTINSEKKEKKLPDSQPSA